MPAIVIHCKPNSFPTLCSGQDVTCYLAWKQDLPQLECTKSVFSSDILLHFYDFDVMKSQYLTIC